MANSERTKKLTRDLDNKMIGGVCSGIAAHYGWDPNITRIVFFLLGGLGFWIYLFLWVVLKPSNKDSYNSNSSYAQISNISNCSKCKNPIDSKAAECEWCGNKIC